MYAGRAAASIDARQGGALAKPVALGHHGIMKTAASPSLPRLLCATLLALAGAACAGTPPASAPDAAASDAAALWQQILAETADAACDGPQHCHSIAVGSKACGGPERYLAWSSKHGDGARLRALAARHAALRKQEDERAGLLSNCMAVQDPGASCRAGRCVLNPPGIGGRDSK